MKRRSIILTATLSAGIAILVFSAYYYYSQGQVAAKGTDGPQVFKVQKGEKVYVRYSGDVVKLIENLPVKNSLKLVSSSQLHNIALGALNGEFRYTDTSVSYTQNGKVRNETAETFKSIEYKFRPDVSTNSTYTYENVNYTAIGGNNQLVATFEQLPTAKVGDRYTVGLFIDAGIITYRLPERIIEITE